MVLGTTISLISDYTGLTTRKKIDPRFFINYPCCSSYNKVDVVDDNCQLEVIEKHQIDETKSYSGEQDNKSAMNDEIKASKSSFGGGELGGQHEPDLSVFVRRETSKASINKNE